MKKTIFFFIFFYSISGIAQDWAPFKVTDTLKHYALKSNISSPIRSILVDTSYSSASLTTHVMKRGYNPSLFNLNGIGVSQRIKGQILGDIIRIYGDSSVLSSIDQNGYRLSFPHNYYQGQNFDFAESYHSSLVAFVDSIYTDSLNGTLDSLARFYLVAYDSLNVLDSSHSFDGEVIIISKNHGLIRTVDFTNLHKKEIVTQYFMNRNFFTNREKYALTIGDEYHYTLDSTVPLVQYHHLMRVIKDTLIGTQRTLTFKHNWRKRWGVLGSIKTNTNSLTFVDNEIAFSAKSFLLEDTLQNWGNGYISMHEFFVNEGSTIAKISHKEDFYYVQSVNLGTKQDTLYPPSLLAGSLHLDIIGISDEYTNWGNGGVGFDRQTKRIVYIKKGNQTSGTPLTLVTGLNEVNGDYDELVIYPNPTEGWLNISSELQHSIIEIIDIHGRKVAKFGAEKKFDVSTLKAGIYLLRMNTEEGILTEKFIKE